MNTSMAWNSKRMQVLAYLDTAYLFRVNENNRNTLFSKFSVFLTMAWDSKLMQVLVYLHTAYWFRVNENNSNTTLCWEFSVFLKPFSVKWDWRMAQHTVHLFRVKSPLWLCSCIACKGAICFWHKQGRFYLPWFHEPWGIWSFEGFADKITFAVRFITCGHAGALVLSFGGFWRNRQLWFIVFLSHHTCIILGRRKPFFFAHFADWFLWTCSVWLIRPSAGLIALPVPHHL